MKIVLQRVKTADVTIDGEKAAEIGKGYLLLVGFEREDDSRFLQPMKEKIAKLKLFPDENGRFAYSIEEVQGDLLLVSQFTLFADLKKGRKPSLSRALEPADAEELYSRFVEATQSLSVRVETGVFGAYMQVSLQNDGPVTIILDSRELFPSLYL